MSNLCIIQRNVLVVIALISLRFVPMQRSSFATPARALVKTMTMTTGEFEFDGIFRQIPGGTEEGVLPEEIEFVPISFILWIIFLILMPILLMNLLVRSCVTDYQHVNDTHVTVVS